MLDAKDWLPFTRGMTVPAPALAVGSMVSVQLGAALSTHLFAAVTPAGTVWLRLVVAASVLMIFTRPRLRNLGAAVLGRTALLGVVTGLMTLTFIEAVARIPLGTAVAIEFLGPLGVAAMRSHRRSALLWPVLALGGVIGLTQPWNGHPDLLGIGFALAAATGWAAYILLTQKVGAELEGLQGLAISLTVAAAATAITGAASALQGLTPVVTLQAVGLGILVPLLPFALEMLTLRRMTISAFGTLMALEPAIATVLGLIVLRQTPDLLQAVGVALVVVAGIGAQRVVRPGRHPEPDQLSVGTAAGA